MLLSDVKKYIKEKKSVTVTELAIEFNLDRDEFETPLNILISKGYIKAELPKRDDGSPSKCGGCPMGCKPKDQESCSPSPSFNIYSWIE